MLKEASISPVRFNYQVICEADAQESCK